jgi:hypothetical protein
MRANTALSDLFLVETFNAHLERIAAELERKPGARAYRDAWKIAARVVREHKRKTIPRVKALPAARASVA